MIFLITKFGNIGYGRASLRGTICIIRKTEKGTHSLYISFSSDIKFDPEQKCDVGTMPGGIGLVLNKEGLYKIQLGKKGHNHRVCISNIDPWLKDITKLGLMDAEKVVLQGEVTEGGFFYSISTQKATKIKGDKK